MRIYIIFLALFFKPISAYGGWYCDQVASEWLDKGKILQSCGIGIGADENEARLMAFNNARKEFDLVCNRDTTCANRVVNIDPYRSACNPTKDGFICHRLFYYYITSEERKPVAKEEVIKQEVRTIETRVTNIYHPVIIREIIRDGKKVDNSYRNLIRMSGRVSVYSTNSRKYQGVYLKNPSESEIESAIRRNQSSGQSAIYILGD